MRAATLRRSAPLAVYLAAQLAATVRDRNRWPFCSNNMFNRAVPRRFEQFRVQLRDDLGWTDPLPVHGLLPLEFFRIVTLFEKVYFVDDVPAQVKDRFSATLLERINTRPWRHLDEVHAPPVPRLGRWADLRVSVVTVDVDDYDVATDQPLHDVTEYYAGIGVHADG